MKINSLLLVLTLSAVTAFVPAPTNAQGRTQGGGSEAVRPAIGILKGQILDAVSNQPIEYSTIALFQMRDSAVSGGTITDPKGNFKVEQIPAGRYNVRVQFMGYETMIIKDIAFRPAEPEVNLGTIKLKPSASSLAGVEVTAEREMMVSNLDKKIINVDKSIASIGGSAVDVMQNIPSVSVDADGNVSLRGSDNITILVDGKPTGLAEISSGDLLQQIPASSIESVEIITNPSVRYDPEGTSGIINIVLKKRSLQGLNGLVSFTAGTGDRYNTSINLNYRKDKFNVFAGYDNRLGRFNSTGVTERNTFNDEGSTLLLQNQVMKNRRDMHNVNTGIDYQLNDFNTLSFNFKIRQMTFGNEGDNRSYTFNEALDTLRNFNRFSESERNIKSYNYTVSYKRTYATKGKELTADFIINDNKMNGNQDIVQTEYTPGFNPDQPSLQRSTSRNTNMMYVAQANFALPMLNGGRIETGFKSSLKDITMRNGLSDFNYPVNDWIFNESAINNFDYFEQIHAVYGIYSASFKNLKYQAGLRAEQLISESDIIQANDQFDLSYLSLFPSVHMVYELTKTQQMSVSYSRRIRRPDNRQLNPYVDYSDSLNIRYGNPKLKPEFVNSYELGWSNFWGKNSVNATLFYRQTVGVINHITRLESPGVTATTYENLNNGKSYGIELIGSREFAKWMKTNLNVSFFRSEIDGSQTLGIEGSESFEWMAKLNLNFPIRKDLNLSLAGNYNSPRTMAQGKMKEVYFADVAVRYDFMKNKASLSFRVSDIFDSRRFDGETWGEGFNIKMNRKMESRVAYLGFTYRINNYNRQRERDRNNQNGEMEMEEF
jgi:outer membrane receptor protein involved in Fe transport